MWGGGRIARVNRGIGALSLVAMLSAAAVTATPAVAQEPSATEVALARRLYNEGVAHARAERWAEAREAFARSLEIAPRPATLLNLASAEMSTGRLVAAAEHYRQYLREEANERHRQRARATLEGLEPRIPSVRFVVSNLADGDTIELDGEPLATAAIGEPLPVDPGRHAIRVVRDRVEIATESFEIDEGATREIALSLPVRVPTPIETAEGAEPRDGVADGIGGDDRDARRTATDDGEGGLLSSPVFWIVAGAVVVGAGATVLVLTTSGGGGGPRFEGNLGSIDVR